MELFVARPPWPTSHKRVPGAHGKRGLERPRGWQKRSAKGWQKVGERLAKGWRRVGEGLVKGWRRVSGFPCTLQLRNSRGARLETLHGICQMDPLHAHTSIPHPKFINLILQCIFVTKSRFTNFWVLEASSLRFLVQPSKIL